MYVRIEDAGVKTMHDQLLKKIVGQGYFQYAEQSQLFIPYMNRKKMCM